MLDMQRAASVMQARVGVSSAGSSRGVDACVEDEESLPGSKPRKQQKKRASGTHLGVSKHSSKERAASPVPFVVASLRDVDERVPVGKDGR